MIVSINQPAYLPWLGYFHRIAISDLHIVLDHVQFEKNSFSNRNKVRTPTGWCWLTVPLKTSGKFGALPLNRVEIAEGARWEVKHRSTLAQNYAKAPFFAAHAPAVEGWYRQSWTRLADLTRETTRYQLDALGIRTPLLFSSQMKVDGAKDELVLNLCKEVGATMYLSGPLGRNYLRPELFTAAGIRVVFQDYVHPTYPQVFPGFELYMAALDLLFNCGPESSQVLGSSNEGIEADLRLECKTPARA
jgi:hypothetical protein